MRWSALLAMSFVALAASAGIDRSALTIPPKIVNVLTKPVRVTAYRVSNRFDRDYAKHKDKPGIAGYPILATTAVPLPAAKAIARELLDPANYLAEGEAWACLFQPHHVVRFESKEGTIDAVICFTCGDVQFLGAAKYGHGLRQQKALHRAVTKVLPE